jgi:lipopolysaccharide export system protein LptC
VFLFARAPTQETTIPYAEIEEIAREPRLSGAQISGVANDGSVIGISVETTLPSGDLMIAENLTASIDSANGIHIDIRAGSGEIDTSSRIARLMGLARVATSNGYEMETVGITANMTTGQIISDAEIEVRTPFGSLTAGQMIIETPEGGDGQVMLFQNGVRLVYTPQQ